MTPKMVYCYRCGERVPFTTPHLCSGFGDLTITKKITPCDDPQQSEANTPSGENRPAGERLYTQAEHDAMLAEVERLRAVVVEYASEDRWTEGEFGVGRYIWRSDKSVPGFNQNANGYDTAKRALSANAETAPHSEGADG